MFFAIRSGLLYSKKKIFFSNIKNCLIQKILKIKKSSNLVVDQRKALFKILFHEFFINFYFY